MGLLSAMVQPLRKPVMALLFIGAAIAIAWYVTTSRTASVIPPPDQEIRDVASRLAGHVEELAGRIGPRHAGRPAALDAAAGYVESRFSEYGYEVKRQYFQAAGTSVANLE